METLEAIKVAEVEAEKIIASAHAEGRKIVEAARQEALKISESATSKRAEYYATEMKKAQQQLNERKKELIAKNDELLSKMRASAEAKMADQIEFLIRKFKEEIEKG